MISQALTPALVATVALVVALPSSADAQTERVRLMAANTSSGNLQSYPNPGPGARIFQALDPDVVLIQEFNVHEVSGGANDDTAVDQWVLSVFGSEFQWFREPGGDQIPNGIISRWPLLETGQWADPNVSNRDFAYARIDVPGPVDLWAVSVHLLTSSATDRNLQAQALAAAIGNHPVPAGDFLMIGGDLNTGNRTENALSTLSTLVITTGPFPDDGDVPPDDDTNSPRNEPFDWVLVDGDLDPLETSVARGAFSFANGLVFDTRIYSQAELDGSFAPALVADSDAEGMQHMAVVRDFLVPAGMVDFSVAPDIVDFGTVDAAAGPFDDASVMITVEQPFTLQTVAFAGTHPGEFSLQSPSLPLTISADTALTLRWDPAANDGFARAVAATFTTDGAPATFDVTLSGTTESAGGPAARPWINELHYDDVNADEGEFVEIAGTAGTDLAGWALEGYNGSGGSLYMTVPLSGIIPSQEGCLGTLAFDFLDLQNGAPDGVALIDDFGDVVQFISYEGSFTANDGTAAGMTSTDIGVAEANSTPAGQSLQLGGLGAEASDFTWQGPMAETPGQPNAAQSFDGCPDLPPTGGPSGTLIR